MLKVLLFLVLAVCISSVTCYGGDDQMIGPGLWMVINILQCEDADQYEMVFTVSRRKMNRTHDCFCLTSDLHREINITYGTIIDVYKKVDGGFKLYHHYSDDCLCELFKKYAEENMKRALTLGGFDPPDCPLKPRSFEIKDFVMDYTELPENGLYGKFKTYVYLVYQGEKIGCIQVLFNFEEGPYEDDDD